MRIVIAGILGGIAMFVWSSLAHTVLPLGHIGFSQIPNESSVLGAMHESMGDKSGLYVFPWADPNDPQMMEKYAAAMKTNPWGILLYHPPGAGGGMEATQLVMEFVKEMVQSLIAAWLLAMAMVSGYAMRVMFVSAIGLAAALTTNASYWIWYKFPLDYSLAYGFTDFMGYVAAGLAIAWWIGRKTA